MKTVERVVYGADCDDYVDFHYDDSESKQLTAGKMIALDRDLANMTVTQSEIDAVLAAAEPMNADEIIRIFGND